MQNSRRNQKSLIPLIDPLCRRYEFEAIAGNASRYRGSISILLSIYRRLRNFETWIRLMQRYIHFAIIAVIGINDETG